MTKTHIRKESILIAQYNFFCSQHGEIIINVPMKEVKETMPCPLCNQDMKRIYSATNSIWKCSGSYGKTSN